MYDTLRFWTMSAADFLDEYFESEIVKAHFSGSSIIGTALGPRSPGSAYVLLHHYMGDIDETVGAWGFARGGMGAVTAALAGFLAGERRRDATARTSRADPGPRRARARRGAGRRRGDPRGDGRVSNIDVKRTFLDSVATRAPARGLPPGRCGASRSAAPPASSTSRSTGCRPSRPFRRARPCIRGDLHITDTIAMMERAYDDWKEGRWSAAPYVDMLMPSQIDPTHGAGRQALHVGVRAVLPVRARRRAVDPTPSGRPSATTVIDAIARHSPDFKSLILHAEIRTPWDIENEVGLTEGNIFQGELTMDQLLFNRPVPGYAQYRTPVKRPVHVRVQHPSRAAASWARRAPMPRGACSRDLGRGVLRMATPAANTRYDCHHHRRRPQRPRLRHDPGARRPFGARAGGRRRRSAAAR